MPPRTAAPYTPSAITSALDGVDAGVHVALTDTILSQVLADGPTAAQARRAQARIPARGQRRSPAITGGQAAQRAGRCGRRLVRDRAALPGRDGDDRRGGPGHPAFGGDRPAPPVESGPRPGHGPADRERRGALAAAGQPVQPDHRELPGRAGTADAGARHEFGRGELHRSLLRKVKGLEDNIRLQASMFAWSRRPPTWPAPWPRWNRRPGGATRHQAKALLTSVSAYLARSNGRSASSTPGRSR